MIVTRILLALFALSLAPYARAAQDGGDGARDDPAVAEALEAELLVQCGPRAYPIDVEVKGGVATLSGTVPSLLQKRRALRVAEVVRGVTGVVDRVRVRDSGRADDEIREDVELVLLLDPAVDVDAIEVLVENGEATLTGTADSWPERELAGVVAMGVRGVREVSNAIAVEPSVDRSDAEIWAEVERMLDWNVLVGDSRIEVGVEDGRVVLEGTVGSTAERRRAIESAWIAGVVGVDAEALHVRPWDARPRRKLQRPERSDEELAAIVRAALSQDPRVDAPPRAVRFQDGEVTLRGSVGSLSARRAAQRAALDVVGVREVRNLLKVRVEQPVDDARLAQDVREALLVNPYLERYEELAVSAEDGTVVLSGEVDSFFEKFVADRAASRVRGVVDVRNKLAVEGLTLTHYEPFFPLGLTFYVAEVATEAVASDRRIEREVREQLRWSPYVEESDVDVEVRAGEVTLRGRVESWLARGAAIENAFQGGARSVVDELAVRSGGDVAREPAQGR